MLAPVILADPVNRSHPLNRGRVAWWLTLPGIDGGRQWFDVAGVSHGTLAGGPTWRGTTRAGGWGHLGAAAGAETIQGPATPSLAVGAADPWALAFWHRTRTFVSLSHSWGWGADLTTLGFPVNGSQRGMLQFATDYYYFGAASDWDSGIAWDTDNVWHRIVLTFDGTDLILYRDGAEVASRSGMPAGTVTSATIPTAFGKHPAGVSSADMDLDDCAIWTRGLSPADARADYDESRRGYPDALNRIAPSLAIAVPPAPTPSSFAFAAATAAALLAATFTATAPGATAATFAATTAGVGLASSFAATTPGGTAFAFSAALAAATATIHITCTEAGVVLHSPDPLRATSRRVGPDPTRSTSRRK